MSILKLLRRPPVLFLIAAIALVTASHSGGKSEGFIRDRGVRLDGERGGQCSGEQIKAPSGVSYILTAGHCRPLANARGEIIVTKQDGSRLMRKIVAEDPKSDLLLLEGLPNLEGLDTADKNPIGNKVRTFTHGAGHALYKTEGEIMEESSISAPASAIKDAAEEAECARMPKNIVVENELASMLLGQPIKMCVLSVIEAITTAEVVPGSSGGMAVNSSGDLIGVVSASDGKFGFLIRLSDIKAFLAGY